MLGARNQKPCLCPRAFTTFRAIPRFPRLPSAHGCIHDRWRVSRTRNADSMRRHAPPTDRVTAAVPAPRALPPAAALARPERDTVASAAVRDSGSRSSNVVLQQLEAARTMDGRSSDWVACPACQKREREGGRGRERESLTQLAILIRESLAGLPIGACIGSESASTDSLTPRIDSLATAQPLRIRTLGPTGPECGGAGQDTLIANSIEVSASHTVCAGRGTMGMLGVIPARGSRW